MVQVRMCVVATWSSRQCQFLPLSEGADPGRQGRAERGRRWLIQERSWPPGEGMGLASSAFNLPLQSLLLPSRHCLDPASTPLVGLAGEGG